MTEGEGDRRERRARAMFRACRPDRSWDAAPEAERREWLAAAHAVEASDAEAGLRPMPLERPFGGSAGADDRGRHRGLGAHSPALGAMYDLGGIAAGPTGAASRPPGAPDAFGPAAGTPPASGNEIGDENPGLPTTVRALLAVGAFIAAAGALLAVGYLLATGSAGLP